MDNQTILELYSIGAVKFGEFTLKSGINSPIYIDFRPIVSYPQLLKKIANILWEKCRSLSFDYICGVPYTALPIATAISLEHGVPMVMRRKEVKEYGTRKQIEGVFEKDKRCLIIEDLVTSGKSVLETTSALEEAGLKVVDIVSLLDREQGGKKALKERGYTLHSAIGLTQLLKILENEKKITAATVVNIKQFLSNQVFA